jgi:glycosyltransferase involved in cell wall biosynthesis
VIAGDGPDRPTIEDLAARDPSVTYLGPVDRAEVLRQMDACAVVVVPSVGYEAMPMVVVEAFSRGRPVLATGHGAMADLIDSEVGWLCEPTADSLATAIGVAASGTRPAPASVRRRFTARFTGDDGARWLLDRYHDLVRARTGASTVSSPC